MARIAWKCAVEWERAGQRGRARRYAVDELPFCAARGTSALAPSRSSALALAVSAHASKPRLRLERIDASSFAADGTVRVFASVVELEGNVDDGRPTPAFVLEMDGKRVGRPEKAQQFQGAAEPLDLVLVIESSALYGPPKVVIPPPPPPAPKGKRGKVKRAERGKGNKIAPELLKQLVPTGGEPLDKVKDAVHALLDGLSPRVRVLLIDYGADMTAHPPFRPAASVDSDVDDLTPDGEAGDLALSRALDAALIQLNKPRRPAASRRGGSSSSSPTGSTRRWTARPSRRSATPRRTRTCPSTPSRSRPTDERGPLLNLGEVSKRSNGTFRWARTADDLRAQIDTLTDELNKQYVLTYKIDARSLEGRRFQLRCEELTSNTLLYDSSGGSFGYVPATRPLLPWWLWALAGIVLFGGAAAVLVRAPAEEADEVLALQERVCACGGSQRHAGGDVAAARRAAAGSRAGRTRADPRASYRRVGRARRPARRRRRAAGHHRQGPLDHPDQRRPGGVDAPRRGGAARRRLRGDRPRLDQRHLRQQPAHRAADAPR